LAEEELEKFATKETTKAPAKITQAQIAVSSSKLMIMIARV